MTKIQSMKKAELMETVELGMVALIELTNSDKKFRGKRGLDGVDTICYNLDIYTLKEATKALNKVNTRFDELAL